LPLLYQDVGFHLRERGAGGEGADGDRYAGCQKGPLHRFLSSSRGKGRSGENTSPEACIP
jgi:hypothetical protein